jgi:hypothetical protein
VVGTFSERAFSRRSAWLAQSLGMRIRLTIAVLVALLAGPVSADQTFAYVATMSGARVGEAHVTVAEEADRYLIFGRAWSTGLADFFARFRSSFVARGRIVDGAPLVDEYRLSQRDKARTRELNVASGVVTEIRDGRLRPEHAAPPEPDMLTALFLRTSAAPNGSPNGDACVTTTAFHTGKHSYRLELRSMHTADMDDALVSYSGPAVRCEYVVTDDDDERSSATVWLADIAGLFVPVRAELDGGFNAGLYLASN